MGKLKNLLQLELQRQNEGLELIASENFTSKKVRSLAGSILTNKYAEGYPGKRYYGGCCYIDEIENLAIDRVTKLFKAKFANVQPHSGSSANLIAYKALLEYGDKILSLSLDEGGHLTHGSRVSFSSKLYQVEFYHLNQDGYIDYEALEKHALIYRPKLIVAGFSSYPFVIDFKKFYEIAKKVGAYFMVDMAHISGLIAGGVYPSPVKYADIITSTTHKTLRGPRGGFILTNSEEIIKKVNFANFPYYQGGPLENIIAAKAQCFIEAGRKSFKLYAKQILLNTLAMVDQFKLEQATVSSTASHLFLLNTKESYGLSGKEAEEILEEVGITVNKNMLPNDQLSPNVTSGIRLGTAALTTRGLKEDGAREIASMINAYLNNNITMEEIKIRISNLVLNLKKVESI